MSAVKGCYPLAGIYKGMIRNWKGRSRLMEGMALYYWPKVIGEEIAPKTSAERMTAGTIWVRTQDAVLAHQLSFMVPKILEVYAGLLGSRFVRNVRFIVGQLAPEPPPEKPLEPPDVDLPASIMESSAEIKDPVLRELFLRSAKKSLIRAAQLLRSGWKPCSCGILTEDGGLCPACRRREEEENQAVLRYFILRHPETSWDEAARYLPGISRNEWEKARQALRQKIEEDLRLSAVFLRRRNQGPEQLVKPAECFLRLGGTKKELRHIVGADLWQSLQRFC